MEEAGDNSPPLIASPNSETPKSSKGTPLYTPVDLTPVHDSFRAFTSCNEKESTPVEAEDKREVNLVKSSNAPEDKTPTEGSQFHDAVVQSISDCDSIVSENCDNETVSDDTSRTTKTMSYETSL